jgi:hypothetical protein
LSGAGTPKINATVAALRFFFRVTLDRSDLGRHLSTIHEPRKAPAVFLVLLGAQRREAVKRAHDLADRVGGDARVERCRVIMRVLLSH